MGLPYLSDANIASIKKQMAGNERALDKIVRKHGIDAGEDYESEYFRLLQMTDEQLALDPEDIPRKEAAEALGFNFDERLTSESGEPLRK